MYLVIVELKLYFFGSTATVHSWKVKKKKKKKKKKLRSHYFSYFPSFFCVSCSFLCVSLLTTSPSASFFLYRPIADLHEPSCHRLIVADPRSTVNQRWPISVSLLCFRRLCLYFGLSFELCLCFEFVFRARFLF